MIFFKKIVDLFTFCIVKIILFDMFKVSEILLLIKILLNNIFKLKSIKSQNYTLVTASDESHFVYLEQLLENFKKIPHFDNFIIYDLGLNESQSNYLKSVKFIDYRKFSFDSYPPHFKKRLPNHGNKIGGFAWKPAILKIIKDEFSDNIVWFDSANLFNKRFIFFKVLLFSRGFISFYSSGTIKDYTHEKVINNLQLINEKDILLSKNLMGGLIGFNAKNEQAIKIIDEWYELCLDESNIFPEGSSLKDHRHDQSILSLCYWKYSRKKLPSMLSLYGVSVQNWPNKILFLFDDRNGVRKKLLENFSMYSTTTDYRCELIFLFNIKNLDKIPLKLLISKKVQVFIYNRDDLTYLKKFKIKSKFINLIYEEQLNEKNENYMKINFENINNYIKNELENKLNR